MICRSLEIFGVTGFLFSLWLHEGEYPDDFPADSDHDARNVEDEPVFDKLFAFLADFVCRYAGHSLNEMCIRDSCNREASTRPLLCR